MNKSFQPVESREECEKIITGTYQGVLSMADNNEPYALPINHAYHDGKFYFHCAATGMKLDYINRNPYVTYVITKYYGEPGNLRKSLKCHGLWESVIATGRARVIADREELLATFKTFLAYHGRDGFQPSANFAETTRAIVVEVVRMTARREYEDERTDFWCWERGV